MCTVKHQLKLGYLVLPAPSCTGASLHYLYKTLNLPFVFSPTVHSNIVPDPRHYVELALLELPTFKDTVEENGRGLFA